MVKKIFKAKKPKLQDDKNGFRQSGEENLQSVSLKNVSLEERRRQADKPLYLTRYE